MKIFVEYFTMNFEIFLENLLIFMKELQRMLLNLNFNWGHISKRLFHWSHLTLKLSSIKVILLWDNSPLDHLPLRLNSFEVFFCWCHLPLRSPYTVVWLWINWKLLRKTKFVDFQLSHNSGHLSVRPSSIAGCLPNFLNQLD